MNTKQYQEYNCTNKVPRTTVTKSYIGSSTTMQTYILQYMYYMFICLRNPAAD